MAMLSVTSVISTVGEVNPPVLLSLHRAERLFDREPTQLHLYRHLHSAGMDTELTSWYVRIQGDPKAQARHRFGGNHVYDPSAKFKQQVLAQMQPYFPERPFASELLLKMRVQFCFKRPPSHWNKKGGLRKNAPRGMVRKPDVDNLCKLVMDVMNEHVYMDDAQIVSLRASKTYLPYDSEEAYTQITIKAVDATEQ